MRAIHGYVPGSGPRKKRAAAASASFPFISEPVGSASSPAYTTSSDSSSPFNSSWTPSPSPLGSADSFTSPLAYTPSDDPFSLYSLDLPTTPDDALFYSEAPSPSSSGAFPSMPASPTASDAWTWDPCFEAACMAMSTWSTNVPPTVPLAGPAMLYPAEHLDLFTPACAAPAIFPAPLQLDLGIEHLVLGLEVPPIAHEPSLYTLPDAAFEAEWDGVVF